MLNGGPAQGMYTFKSGECVNVALFAKGFFGDVIKSLERRPSQITQVRHKPNDRCPSRRQDEMTQTRRGQDHVKIKAEIGVTQPQVNKCQEPPEDGRGFSLRALRRRPALCFQTSALKNCETGNSSCLKPPDLWSFLTIVTGN